MASDMRIIGLDVGHRRIGVALSDETGLIAQPLETVEVRDIESALEALAKLCSLHEVEKIVVGMPLSLSGGDRGSSARLARAVAKRLAGRTALPVVFVDERFSSTQAQRVLLEGNASRRKRKGAVDKMAAAIILQTYLDQGDRH